MTGILEYNGIIEFTYLGGPDHLLSYLRSLNKLSEDSRSHNKWLQMPHRQTYKGSKNKGSGKTYYIL